MAETEHSAGMAQDAPSARELTINLRPYGWSVWELEGTRAQLEAEGVIPAGTKWPESGNDWVTWDAGVQNFRLSRARPPGLKGPMRLWINGDWWRLHSTRIGSFDPVQQRVREARQKLELATYHASPAGQRAWGELCRRLRAAEGDRAFQAFKALVPGLIPPRRGRKASGGA